MPVFLAQSTIADGPQIAWSSFAPELAVVCASLVLLLLAVAGSRRLLVGIVAGVPAIAAGVWLVTEGFVVPGAVTIALGAAAPALVVAFPGRPSLTQSWGAGLSLLAALVLTFWQYAEVLAPEGGLIAPQSAMQGALANDGIGFFTRITVYLSALLVIPIGYGYLRDRRIGRAEVEPLLLLSVAGMAFLGTANDLITLFISLEVLSMALYILTGLARRDRRSQESSLKYFILGSVASAILLYGMALLYVATGSLDLPTIGAGLGLVTTPSVVGALGLALVTVGIGFKVALAPFHLWTPDVYQGAPTNVTAFMAAAVKAAGFAALLRLYLVAFPALEQLWIPVLSVLAAISMLYGAWVAIVQRDVKRMLAFSSITHAGYATIGVVSNSDAGLSATLWYLLTYAVATLGAFGCVLAIERVRRGEVTLVDLRGLGKTSPLLAGIFTLCLLSLAGVPATAGFIGKLVVFQAGVAAGHTWLVVIGVLSSVIAAFFYLRLAGMMFLEDVEEGRAIPLVTTGLSAGVYASAVLVLFLGIWPQLLLQLSEYAAAVVR
ncbi:NADH-quinone oxidoreductase subunit N [Egicoccus halophilus]|uniref:NADH-quinone oxidoreductase subunit N n=1 Tax=Egicoccus halophilus TaxID=1670830 RepID=A0A8J3ETS5_9ACTN|nr:NADH-quinone oxidoreductase subunit N [Egicoccus halophilus]GGI05741.1 NADH-quinone oxidoreductase subunit N [Egicoccus halophilus]